MVREFFENKTNRCALSVIDTKNPFGIVPDFFIIQNFQAFQVGIFHGSFHFDC